MRANFVLSGVAAGIRRNLGMTIALVLSTSIALGFVGAAILANKEITKFKQQYQSKLNVSVYLCAATPAGGTPTPPCTAAATTTAQTQAIQRELDQDPDVISATYVSEQEAYENGKKTFSDQVAQFLQPGDLPASFTVKLRDIRRDYTAFQVKYSQTAGVGQVTNQVDSINALLNIIDSTRIFSIVLAVIVLLASILLIANTIQVAAAQRKNETSIMRLVGASRLMTELPFVLEAMVATALGGLIAFGFIWGGKNYVLDSVFHGPTQRHVIPNLGINDVLVAGGVGLAGGILIAALTAFVTLRLRVKL